MGNKEDIETHCQARGGKQRASVARMERQSLEKVVGSVGCPQGKELPHTGLSQTSGSVVL